MFEHFQIMLDLEKNWKKKSQCENPKNQLFGKKKFSDFSGDQFFFFLKFF